MFGRNESNIRQHITQHQKPAHVAHNQKRKQIEKLSSVFFLSEEIESALMLMCAVRVLVYARRCRRKEKKMEWKCTTRHNWIHCDLNNGNSEYVYDVCCSFIDFNFVHNKYATTVCGVCVLSALNQFLFNHFVLSAFSFFFSRFCFAWRIHEKGCCNIVAW